MVISYTKSELYAIGEMMTLKECLTRGKMSMADIDCKPMYDTSEFIKTFQDMIICHQQNQNNVVSSTTSVDQNIVLNQTQPHHQQQHNHHHQQHQEPALTSSVAEFFRKAQQNFYAQTTIDPTKVRRLSEIEAELINGERGDSN